MQNNHNESPLDTIKDKSGKSKGDFDSPWKSILEKFFWDFIEFYFPKIHQCLDSSGEPEFLNTDLARWDFQAQVGTRVADKLAKVLDKNGKDAFLFIHIEIQRASDPAFAERMFVYNSRIWQKYKQDVVSLALFIGEQNSHVCREGGLFKRERLICSLVFRFPIATLRQFESRAEQRRLDGSLNPFGILTLASLSASRYSREPQSLYSLKLAFTKRLFDEKWSREGVRELWSFIDWILHLEEDLDEKFWNDLIGLEVEMGKKYITSMERYIRKKAEAEGMEQGMQRGMQQGMRIAINQLLKQRLHGTIPEALVIDLASLADADREEFFARLLDFSTAEDIQRWLSTRTLNTDVN